MFNPLKAFWYRRPRHDDSWRSCRHADPLTLLCVIGSPLLLICIIAIFQSEGIDVVFFFLGIAIVGIVVSLGLLVVTIAKYLTARVRTASRLLQRHTPPRTQVILRLLPKVLRIMAVPLFLLSVAGDTSGLLGLLCCLQIGCFLTWIGLFIWSFVRAGRLEALARQQARQQERWPAGQLLLRAVPEERVRDTLYAQPTESRVGEDQSPTSPYADYEQPQSQYPIQMPPT